MSDSMGDGGWRGRGRGVAAPAIAALGLALACLSFVAAGIAEETGRVLYLRYCASCHGVSGTGDGPAASAFRARPTDLTGLAARAGGRFPFADVMASIDGRRFIAAHGSREMPVWGERFRAELEGAQHPERTTLLREQAIVDYLATMQRK